jgi:hypothetical protein
MMSKKNSKTIGIVLLVVGVALLVWGFDIYGAFGSKLTRAVSGDISNKALGLFIIGGICSGLGVYKILGK